MNVNMRKWALFVAVATTVAVVVLTGCSSKKSQSEAPAASSQAAPQAATPSGGAEHAMSVFPKLTARSYVAVERHAGDAVDIAEAHARSNSIVIDDAQTGKLHMRGIVIFCK
jgi:hypothetical protein